MTTEGESLGGKTRFTFRCTECESPSVYSSEEVLCGVGHMSLGFREKGLGKRRKTWVVGAMNSTANALTSTSQPHQQNILELTMATQESPQAEKRMLGNAHTEGSLEEKESVEKFEKAQAKRRKLGLVSARPRTKW